MKVQYWLVVSNNVWVYRSNKNKEQKTLSSVCFLNPAPFCGIGQGNMNRYCSDLSYMMQHRWTLVILVFGILVEFKCYCLSLGALNTAANEIVT